MPKQKHVPVAANAKKLFMASTIVLTMILALFLAVTVSGMYQLNSQIKLSTEHPFVVSRHVGLIRNNVTQMRIRTERLRFYNHEADIELVSNALDELYIETDPIIAEVIELYIGPLADSMLISDTMDNIKAKHDELLEFASMAERSRDEIFEFEEHNLQPLYQKIDDAVTVILAFTQNTQMTVYNSSNALWKSTCLFSLLLAVITLACFIIFQRLLNNVNNALYAKNNQFDLLSHTIDETFLIFQNENPCCDFVAENSMRVLGLSTDDILNNRYQFYNYINDESRKALELVLLELEEGASRELSTEYKHPISGKTCWMLQRIYKTGFGDDERYIVSISDQTAAVVANRNLVDALKNSEQANNARRDFLSRMSHEIRTPMNAIIGMTTIAGASIDRRDRVEDCLAKISYASKHLLLLINDILDMSRIESNKLSLNNEPFDIFQFVNTFISVFYPQAQTKSVELSERMSGFSEDTAYIGDSMRLNQILLNLMSNAIKFTPEGGKVSLNVTRIPSSDGKERIRFVVEDNGIGMDEDALARLYEPFVQANASIAQKYGGTGLGMSITKNLVSLMSGYINVQSQEGVGTTCIVEIPFDKSNVDIDVLAVEDLQSLHVLVVDDEQDMCEHTTLLLTKIKIRSEWTLSGREAIIRAQAARERGDVFDICFIDWQMPDMDGIETARRLRATLGPDTPIIIISAYDWAAIESDARAAGVNAFISKPLFLSSVYNVLVNVTNGRFARQHVQRVDGNVMLLEGRRILVAEDNELNLEIAEAMLEMNGAEVECVTDGKQAGDIFASYPKGYFDAILMDIQMPVMNGYDATQRIRAMNHPDAATIPIIATTANAFAEDVADAIAAGMNAHVSKPIDTKVLCEVLIKFM